MFNFRQKQWAFGAWATASAIAIVLAVVTGCKSPTPSPFRHFDNLVIQGSLRFDEQVEKSLTLLKTSAHAAYANVTNYVGIILEHEHSGMEVHHNPPIFQLNGNSAFYSVTWCAGVIAHDSYHSKLFFDYKKQHPWSLWVPAETHGGARAERDCLEHQLQVLKDIHAPTNEIAWCQQCLTQTNQYWKVKYKDRNW
jgi:hypothetical protein